MNHEKWDSYFFENALNTGQEYAITVNAPTAMASFCPFFTPSLAEDVFYNLATTTVNLQ